MWKQHEGYDPASPFHQVWWKSSQSFFSDKLTNQDENIPCFIALKTVYPILLARRMRNVCLLTTSAIRLLERTDSPHNQWSETRFLSYLSSDLFNVNLGFSIFIRIMTSMINFITEGGQASFHLMRINRLVNNEPNAEASDWYELMKRVHWTLSWMDLGLLFSNRYTR